jgi:hypothetical protein
MGCFYSDICNEWQDVGDREPAWGWVELHEARYALCDGRHPIPDAWDGSIYGTEVDPLAVEELQAQAVEKLRGLKKVTIYVTGLTVALIAALNAARELGVEVTLYHYDRESGDYYPQKVL